MSTYNTNWFITTVDFDNVLETTEVELKKFNLTYNHFTKHLSKERVSDI